MGVCWTSLSLPSGHSHVSLYISTFLCFFHPQLSLLLYSDAEDISALTYDLMYYHSSLCSGPFVPRYNQYSCLFFSTLMLRIGPFVLGPFVPRSCPYTVFDRSQRHILHLMAGITPAQVILFKSATSGILRNNETLILRVPKGRSPAEPVPGG